MEKKELESEMIYPHENPLKSKTYTVIILLGGAAIFTKLGIILPYIKDVRFLKWVFQMSTLNYHCVTEATHGLLPALSCLLRFIWRLFS